MKIKSYIIFTVFLLSLNQSYGQKYEMKKQLTPDEKKELLDISNDILKIEPLFFNNFSEDEFMLSFSKKDYEKLKKRRNIEELEKRLSKDSLNAGILFDIGYYYQKKGSQDTAKSYFQKSFNNLSYEYFKGDTSRFYSFRGVIKFRLNDNDAINDIEKSLLINPNDSLAITFYPIILIINGRNSDAKNWCLNLLESKRTSYYFSQYGFYMILNLTESIQFLSLANDLQKDENKKEEYRKKDFYNQLFDLSAICKYIASLKSIRERENLKAVADTYALFFKFSVFKHERNDKVIMEYTQNDTRRLKELNDFFVKCSDKNIMNEYTVNKYLGFVNYMLDNQETAINYFIKAIEAFPMAERNSEFDPNETYESLLAMYYYKNDTANFRNTLERKIANEPPGIKLVRDYRNMAFYYFSIGQREKAMEWAKKAKEIDSKDFETQRLLTHLYALVNMYTIADYYLKNSEKLISGCTQIYKFCLQIAIYQLSVNDVSIAFENITKARESFYEFNPTNRPCELCDKLIENYIEITE